MKSANPESKHIAKAAQANAKTKALSKSLLCPPKKKNKKISTASQKLNLPINEPTDQNNLTIKEIKQLTNSEISTDERRTTTHNSVYVTIAGEVVNRRSELLKNFVLNGQESASNPLLHIHAKR